MHLKSTSVRSSNKMKLLRRMTEHRHYSLINGHHDDFSFCAVKLLVVPYLEYFCTVFLSAFAVKSALSGWTISKMVSDYLGWHYDVIKWKHFPRYWPFVREIHRSPVNFPYKGQWRGALMFTLICARMNDWVNNREAGDLRRYLAHYDVIVMESK